MFEGIKLGHAEKPYPAAPILTFCYFPSYMNLASTLKINGPTFSFFASHFCGVRRGGARSIATDSVRDLRHMGLH